MKGIETGKMKDKRKFYGQVKSRERFELTEEVYGRSESQFFCNVLKPE